MTFLAKGSKETLIARRRRLPVAEKTDPEDFPRLLRLSQRCLDSD
jgi:hypothetical protein